MSRSATAAPARGAGRFGTAAAVGAGLYLLFLLLFASVAARNPFYNWDLIPYVACALSLEGEGGAVLHERTYAAVREGVPPAVYQELTVTGPYRRAMEADAEGFRQQLPFYRSRVLYTGLVALLHQAGIGVVRATSLISLAACVYIFLLLPFWLWKHAVGGWPFLCAAAIVLAVNLLDVAKLSTPDALSATVILTALWSAAERKPQLLTIALLALAVLVRTDNVILVLVLLAYLRFLAPPADRLSTPRFALGVSLALVCYGVLNTALGGYGWATLLYQTFVQPMPRPAEQAVGLPFEIYPSALAQSLGSIFQQPHFAFFVLSAALSLRFGGGIRRDLRAGLVAVLAATLALRFLIYPLLNFRFFVAFYAATAVLLALHVAERCGPRAESSAAA